MEKREVRGIFLILCVIVITILVFRQPAPEPAAEPVKEEPKVVEVVELEEYKSETHYIELGEDYSKPDYIVINQGDTVVWKNVGNNRRRFWINEEIYSELLEPGETYSYTFTIVGDHTFRDVFNGLVRGAVVVKSQPAIRITGSFLKGFTETQKRMVGIQFLIFVLAVGILIYTMLKK